MLSIVVPVYNNAEYLLELHQRTCKALEAEAIDWELLLVEDGSVDGSWALIQQLGQIDSRVRGLRFSRNFGQHAAISAGFETASGDVCVLMDADLQDRPELIPQLLEALRGSGNDIIYTIKQNDTERLSRRLTSRAFHGMVGRSTGSDTSSDIGTFRIFRRNVLEALLRYQERSIVYGPLMHTMGFNYGFLEIPRDPRLGSGSSYSFRRRLALAYRSIMTYSTLPQQLMLWMGGTVSVVSTLYLVAILARYLLVGSELPRGVTLLTALMLLFIGMVMFGLGVLASYLFLIFQEVLARPRYHVRGVVNLQGGNVR